MKRTKPPQRRAKLGQDPAKVRDWQRRSAQTAQENARDRPRKPLQTHRGLQAGNGSGKARTSGLRARVRPEEPGKAAAAERFKREVCGSLDSRLDAHHVLPAQTLRRLARSRGLTGPAFWAVVYDPRVGVALERKQHADHTVRARQIPREHLPHARMAGIRAAIEEYGPEAQRAFDLEHPPLTELRRRTTAGGHTPTNPRGDA